MKKLCAFILTLIFFIFNFAGAEENRLPDYVYRGDDKYLGAVCDYILREFGRYYDREDVSIPCPIILEADDSDPGDVKLWGVFALDNYRLINTTLFSESGGADSGLMHLKAENGAWQVCSVETVGDGDDFSSDVKRIFGVHEGLLERYMALTDSDVKEARLRFASDYVKQNSLNVTQMQDFGRTPVPLIGAPETAEADRLAHYTGKAGYALDYDLRLFSYIRFDENEEGFAGVDALEGISMYVRSLPSESADDAAQALAAEMNEPVIEQAAIGKDMTPALCVRDDSLPDGVYRRTYVVSVSGGCLTITAGNTYYSMEGYPVVEGGEAALESLLASLTLAN